MHTSVPGNSCPDVSYNSHRLGGWERRLAPRLTVEGSWWIVVGRVSPEGRNLEWGGSGRSHSRSGAVGVQVGVDRILKLVKGQGKAKQCEEQAGWVGQGVVVPAWALEDSLG